MVNQLPVSVNKIEVASLCQGYIPAHLLNTAETHIDQQHTALRHSLPGELPADSWLASSSQLFLFGLALLLFSIFLMAFLNFLISARISDPIRRLERSVKELERGLEIEVAEGGCYEVQQLGHAIRSMVSTW